jgi:hypothetical protein
MLYAHDTSRSTEMLFAEYLDALFYMKQLCPAIYYVFFAVFFISQRDLRNRVVRCTVVSV